MSFDIGSVDNIIKKLQGDPDDFPIVGLRIKPEPYQDAAEEECDLAGAVVLLKKIYAVDFSSTIQFRDLLKESMGFLGITARELSGRLEVSQSIIERWVGGLSFPPAILQLHIYDWISQRILAVGEDKATQDEAGSAALINFKRIIRDDANETEILKRIAQRTKP